VTSDQDAPLESSSNTTSKRGSNTSKPLKFIGRLLFARPLPAEREFAPPRLPSSPNRRRLQRPQPPRRRNDPKDPEVLEETYRWNLWPFSADPIFYGRLARWRVPVFTTVLIAACIPAAIVAVAAAKGALTVNASGSLWHDFLRWAFGAKPPKAETIQDPSVPLFRDYPTLILALDFAVSVPLVYYMYHQLSVLYGSLHTNHCFGIDADDRPVGNGANGEASPNTAGTTTFPEEYEALTSSLRAWGRSSRAVFLGCVALAFAMYYFVAQRTQAFDAWVPFNLHGKSAHNWAVSARASWWAAPWKAGAVVWLFFGAFALYSFITQSFVGWRWLRYLTRTSYLVSYSANPTDPDGQYGWRRLRNLVVSLLFGSLPLSTIVAIAVYKIFRSSYNVYLAVLILAIFIVNVFVMMTFLLIHLGNNVRRAKRVRVLELTEDMEQFSDLSIDPNSGPEMAYVACQAIRDELQRVAATPNLPIKGQSILISFLVTAAPLVAAILDLFASVKKGG
jgi:hypothetical protein